MLMRRLYPHLGLDGRRTSCLGRQPLSKAKTVGLGYARCQIMIHVDKLRPVLSHRQNAKANKSNIRGVKK